jgi:hypothetical protein
LYFGGLLIEVDRDRYGSLRRDGGDDLALAELRVLEHELADAENSRTPRRTETFASGVSPAFTPSIQTSAQGAALMFTRPCGSSATRVTSPGTISTVSVAEYPRSWFVSWSVWVPGVSRI